MHEKNIIIKTRDGNLDCKIFINRNINSPAVIFYMDAPGIREELRAMCRRILKNGYNVLLPNLFYRVGTEGNYPFNQLLYKESKEELNRMILNGSLLLIDNYKSDYTLSIFLKKLLAEYPERNNSISEVLKNNPYRVNFEKLQFKHLFSAFVIHIKMNE